MSLQDFQIAVARSLLKTGNANVSTLLDQSTELKGHRTTFDRVTRTFDVIRPALNLFLQVDFPATQQSALIVSVQNRGLYHTTFTGEHGQPVHLLASEDNMNFNEQGQSLYNDKVVEWKEIKDGTILTFTYGQDGQLNLERSTAEAILGEEVVRALKAAT